MRIAVYGTGGAGGYFGAKLAQAGEDVVFIARGEHLKAIQAQGLRIDSPEGNFVIQPAQAFDDPGRAGVVDAIILGVKTWQVGDAAQAMRPMIGPETFVVPFQNGVEAASQLAAVLGAEHVVGGLAGSISFLAGPGHIRSNFGKSYVKFAELDDKPSQRTEKLQQAFSRAGIQASVPDNIQTALWEKFLFVVPQGGVGAVTRAPVGTYRSVPETRQLLEQSMREVHAVARAHQITIPDDAVEKTMAIVDSLPVIGTTSMQRDFMEGKPSELEAWNGAVVRLGQAVHAATPVNAFIYASLLPLELRARGRIQFGS